MVIYGFEDQPLSDVPLVTFTKHEFGEQDVTATAIWGDGTVGTMPVVVNADNRYVVSPLGRGARTWKRSACMDRERDPGIVRRGGACGDRQRGDHQP